MAEEFGSQCGFCTPGIVMSFYCLDKNPSEEDIERSVDGNLCRCTGYRSILSAAKKACSIKDIEDFGIKRVNKLPPHFIEAVKEGRQLVHKGQRAEWRHIYKKEQLLEILQVLQVLN